MSQISEISRLSMVNDMQRLEVISHNLANVNTPGFKREMLLSRTFDNLLSTQLSSRSVELPTRPGSLVPTTQRMVDESAGVLSYSGNALDLAIDGNAYFELEGEGGTYFSRQGSFLVDSSGRLARSDGYVLSAESGDILLQGGDVVIDKDGRVFEDGELAGQIKLVAFPEHTEMQRLGKGLLLPKGGEPPQQAGGMSVKQGYREASNVGVMDEMVALIAAVRHLETTSLVMKGYDEMVGTAISTIAEF